MTTTSVIYLIVAILWGIWCASIAKKHGWSQTIAFIIGLLVGVFGVIGYAIAGNSDNNKKRDAKLDEILKTKVE
jgi:glucose uptake protein GlcU